MAMESDAKELKPGLVEFLAKLAGYLPDVLDFIGAPRQVAQAARHTVRMVPAIRNAATGAANNGIESAMNNRFASILAVQEQLDGRCSVLEQENTRMKLEMAGAASQIQLLQAETLALRKETETLQKRNLYLSVGVLVVFLLAISEFAMRFVK
ncbi:MAG TPA: hypothetical protein VKT71_03710 [Candidatus Acidoferrales bacterium]|nr:hypothetical protein [Candidatus Acidoferrales bacterium]